MSKEISLSFLLKTLKSAWWKILIVTVVVATLVAVFTEFFIPKKYVSTVEFYVINTQAGAEYSQLALLSATEWLSSDYIKLIKSDHSVQKIHEYLKEENDVDVSPDRIRGMISANIAAESSTFSITVTTTYDKLSYAVANAIEKNAPEIIKEMSAESELRYYKRVVTGYNSNGEPIYDYEPLTSYDREYIAPIRSAKLPSSHSSPNVAVYTIAAAVVAAFIMYTIILILKLSDTTIRSEETVKEILDPSIPIIGKIPEWTDEAKKSYGR